MGSDTGAAEAGLSRPNGLLNILRAGVLGAQDGIVSTAGLVVGVAGATAESSTLLIAGLAGLVGGSLSMAGGEYVSVSTQRDTEKALGLDPDEYTSPWQAAVTSTISFAAGAALPLLAILLTPLAVRVPITFVVVVIALTITGFFSAKVGGAPPVPAVLRNVVVGVLTMAVTYFIGSMIGMYT